MSGRVLFTFTSPRRQYQELFGVDLPGWVQALPKGNAMRLASDAVRLGKCLAPGDGVGAEASALVPARELSVGNIGRYQTELVEIIHISDQPAHPGAQRLIDCVLLRKRAQVLRVSAPEIEWIADGHPRKPPDFEFDGMGDPRFMAIFQAGIDASMLKGNGVALEAALSQICPRMESLFDEVAFLGEIELRVAEVYAMREGGEE